MASSPAAGGEPRASLAGLPRILGSSNSLLMNFCSGDFPPVAGRSALEQPRCLAPRDWIWHGTLTAISNRTAAVGQARVYGTDPWLGGTTGIVVNFTTGSITRLPQLRAASTYSNVI